jgi:hypothetical protein
MVFNYTIYELDVKAGCGEGTRSASENCILARMAARGIPWGRAGPLPRAPMRASRPPLHRADARGGEAGRRGGVPQTAGTCRALLTRREALGPSGPVAGLAPPQQEAARVLRPGVRQRQDRWGTPREAGAGAGESLRPVGTPWPPPPPRGAHARGLRKAQKLSLSAHLCQRGLSARQPERHLHSTVHGDGSSEFRAGLLPAAGRAIQRAETTVTMGLEGAHAACMR